MPHKDTLTTEARFDSETLIKAIDAPWNIAVNAIAGGRPITARDLALAQMRNYENQELFWSKGNLAECVIYIPHNKPSAILVCPSPLLENKLAEEATIAHNEKRDISIDRNVVQLYLDMVNVRGSSIFKLKMEKDNRNSIPPKKINEDENMVRLFQDITQDYGEFLHYRGIKDLTFLRYNQEEIDSHKSPFINQLNMGSVGQHIWSIDGFWKLLGCKLRTRALFSGYSN